MASLERAGGLCETKAAVSEMGLAQFPPEITAAAVGWECLSVLHHLMLENRTIKTRLLVWKGGKITEGFGIKRGFCFRGKVPL